jgi:cell division transport system permease protein
VGTFVLLVENMEGLLERFGNELQVVAYLEADLPEEEQRAIAARAATIEGVAGVELVTSSQALERFRAGSGGADLLAGLDENPLPASLEIQLDPTSRTELGIGIVASALDGLPGVDELSHGQSWVEGYARAAALMRTVSVVLGSALSVAALLIVANTMRLAVYARQDELEILSLVGAGRIFQRAPFLIEGAVQGTLGGLLALVLLYVAFRSLLPQLEYGLALVLGQATPRFFEVREALALVAAGSGLGILGSGLAVVGWRR